MKGGEELLSEEYEGMLSEGSGRGSWVKGVGGVAE